MAKVIEHARVGTVRCTCGRQFDRTAGRNMHVTKANKALAAATSAIADAVRPDLTIAEAYGVYDVDARDDMAGVTEVHAPHGLEYDATEVAYDEDEYVGVDDAIAAHEAEFAPLDLNAAELGYRRAVDEVLEADRAYAAAYEAKEAAERRRLDADNALAPAFAAYRAALKARIG